MACVKNEMFPDTFLSRILQKSEDDERSKKQNFTNDAVHGNIEVRLFKSFTNICTLLHFRTLHNLYCFFYIKL